MQTAFLTIALSTALITAAAGVGIVPAANARDAAEALETVQSHCSPVVDNPRAPRFLNCVAIYRNGSDRPVFDIAVQVTIEGQPVSCLAPECRRCCEPGTRTALAPGESAVTTAMVAAPAGAEADTRMSLSFRAAWTGDERALDVPQPELQYVDLVPGSNTISLLGEVRNVDERTWEIGTDDEKVWREPIIAYFQRGKLVGAAQTGRVPYGRIRPDGRYLFLAHRDVPYRAFDAVQVFYRDAFVTDQLILEDARWQLTGLDHTVVSDSSGWQRMEFRVSVRNSTDWPSEGNVYVIARRADYHAIGIGDCWLRDGVAPRAEASCSGVITLDMRPDVTGDAVRFVTVELGGAVALLPTPTPLPTTTPCPARNTAAPVPTLASVADRLWLPWSIRTLAESCP